MTWSGWETCDTDVLSPYAGWVETMHQSLGLEDDHVKVVAAQSLESKASLEQRRSDTDYFLVPRAAVNPSFVLDATSFSHVACDAKACKAVLAGCKAVVAIIDVDVALGHRRFRSKTGETRVLASWQQAAPYYQDTAQKLPFGQVLRHDQINTSLRQFSEDHDLTKSLDQDTFNRAAGLTRFDVSGRIGGLAKRFAHGTHVLGTAAGHDPLGSFADEVKIIVVNLPPTEFYGEGGAFLDHYISYGLIWAKQTLKDMAQLAGLKKIPPLFANISFGKQVGADGFVPVEGDTRNQSKPNENVGSHAEDSLPKTTILVPAGNENLDRYHGRMDLGASIQTINWRTQPDDGTSNFMEIWADDLSDAKGHAAPFQIDVISPNGKEGTFQAPRFPRSRRDLAKHKGRIYFDSLRHPETGIRRARYVICLGPNGLDALGDGCPKAGLYKIRLKNITDQTLTIRMKIQTDQAALPKVRNAKTSYFEDPNYKDFDNQGRWQDSYSYSSDQPENQDENETGYVRRHGSLNAYANFADVVVAGYTATDGRPAPYSGTVQDPDDLATTCKLVAFPSDDGTVHFGVLSDGSADGSKVALRGTSFACAAATRFAVEHEIANKGEAIPPVFAMAMQAHLEPQAQTWTNETVPKLKAGWGRIAATQVNKVDRF